MYAVLCNLLAGLSSCCHVAVNVLCLILAVMWVALQCVYKLRVGNRKILGAQWLSGRVLDSRPKGRDFEPHPASLHCVLEQEH